MLSVTMLLVFPDLKHEFPRLNKFSQFVGFNEKKRSKRGRILIPLEERKKCGLAGEAYRKVFMHAFDVFCIR